MLPLQGAWVRSLVGELRSRMPCGEANSNNNNNNNNDDTSTTYAASLVVLLNSRVSSNVWKSRHSLEYKYTFL